jgi:hypothetical protein
VRTEQLPDAESCWALLERVAASAQLCRKARLKELLFYIGKRSLVDGSNRVNEQEIGSNVFNRPESYDTNVDNIVRTNVSDLRKRIEAYFNSEGSHEPLIMVIPRGSYIPVFRPRITEAETADELVSDLPATATEAAIETQIVHPLPAWIPPTLIGAGMLILLLGAAYLHIRSEYRVLHQTLFAWEDRPSVAEFWSRLLSSNSNTDIVISDPEIGMVQALSKKTFPLNDYLNGSYISQLQNDELSPDMHTAINRIIAGNLASPDEFMFAHRILALDPSNKNLHLYNARNYVPDLIRRDNVILIGARKTNPWDELFDGRLNFVPEFDDHRVIDRAPVGGEQAAYASTNPDGYCVVAYLPNSENTGQVLLVEGTNAEATEAAGDFLLSEDQLAAFKKTLHVSVLPYFQVLLKVSSVRGAPLAETVVAYRVSIAAPKTTGQ